MDTERAFQDTPWTHNKTLWTHTDTLKTWTTHVNMCGHVRTCADTCKLFKHVRTCLVLSIFQSYQPHVIELRHDGASYLKCNSVLTAETPQRLQENWLQTHNISLVLRTLHSLRFAHLAGPQFQIFLKDISVEFHFKCSVHGQREMFQRTMVLFISLRSTW